jgi:hypothetical protein
MTESNKDVPEVTSSGKIGKGKGKDHGEDEEEFSDYDDDEPISNNPKSRG